MSEILSVSKPPGLGVWGPDLFQNDFHLLYIAVWMMSEKPLPSKPPGLGVWGLENLTHDDPLLYLLTVDYARANPPDWT